MNNYTILHCHTMFSNGTTNIDSITKPEEYIAMAKELGMKAISFSEHGNIFKWVKKKELCEKAGLKYIHSVELYVTESLETKVRDNYHILLIAKNFEGVKELNELLTKAYNRKDNHFYYVPRISLKELKKTSKNIIVSTACLGGILHSGTKNIKREFMNFALENKERVFLEIQHHNVKEQIEYNNSLVGLSKKTGLKLLATTDTHALNETHIKGRKILQKAKNIHFENEEGWDLTLKTYDELVEAFREQGLDDKIIYEALENTNVIADMVEEFELDRSFKYPKLYDNSLEVFKQKIQEGIKSRGIDKLPNYRSEYIPRIKEEISTYIKTGSVDYMLLDAHIKEWARENGITYGYGRGSVNGSLVAYLLYITEMDSVKFNLNFSRFMNKDRISAPDIDTDWSPSQRHLVKEYLYTLGFSVSSIITFNTIALKGAIKDVGRALDMPLSVTDEITKNIDTKEKYYREKHPELFEYVDIVKGCVVSIGQHPAGSIVSPIDLKTNIGLCSMATTDELVSMCDMKEVDSLGLIKLDILGLDNSEIIAKTCKLANIPYITPDNVNLEDENVWLDIRYDCTSIFQWEGTGEGYIKDLFSDKTISNIKRNNKNFSYLTLFSVGNGALRPAGASYRNTLSTGIYQDNGHEALNEMLSESLGFLVYQEQVLEFLNKFCGFTMARADIVRRNFSKKVGTEKDIPVIKAGFIKTMKEEYEVEEVESTEIVENFLRVIEDASDYLFSKNHSDPYSIIGYACGYLRYYYPLEFLTVCLQTYKKEQDHIQKLVAYAKKRNIKVESPKFRKSKSEYFFDRDTNTIYQGIDGIKYLNNAVGEALYELRNKEYNSFIDVLVDITNICNSRQLEILIKLDYFSEFSKSNKLLKITELFNKYYHKKQFKKADLSSDEIKLLKTISQNESEKMFTKVDTVKYLEYLIQDILDEDIALSEKIQAYLEYTGTLDGAIDKNIKSSIFVISSINTKYTPKLDIVRLKDGRSTSVKVSKTLVEAQPLKSGDVIEVLSNTRKQKNTLVNGKWTKTNEFDIYITYKKL